MVTSSCPILCLIISPARSANARSTDHPEFEKAENEVRTRTKRLLDVNGKRSVDSFHRELGLLLWDKCGMARNAAGLQEALARIPADCARNSGITSPSRLWRDL